jgi:hypothetical protein
MRRRFRVATSIAFALVAAGCVQGEKSENPLAPTIAGPLPGVNLTIPSPVRPMNTRIAVDQQPLTLTVDNAVTTSPRPFSYLIQIATDANFNNIVFSRDGIAPATGAQTSFRLPDPLATGHTYYWRARAQDGANSSNFSVTATFDVFTPIVLQAPVLVSPVGGTSQNRTPTFTWNDAARSGPAGAIVYEIEAADNDAFANKYAFTVAETPNQTSFASPTTLPANITVYWHVRATDPTTIGPFSATASFKTPAPAPPPPTTGGGGGGGGSVSPNDQLNLSTATVTSGPRDVASWPATIAISQVRIDPTVGVSMSFSPPAPEYWKVILDPSTGDNFQYTAWMCAKPNGAWLCAAFVQMWQGRAGTGAAPLTGYVNLWGSGGSATAGAFGNYVPSPGDPMAFFATAGNARGQGGATSVAERSNTVIINLPGGDSGVYSY